MEVFRNEISTFLILFPLGDVYKCAGGHMLPLLPQALSWHRAELLTFPSQLLRLCSMLTRATQLV